MRLIIIPALCALLIACGGGDNASNPKKRYAQEHDTAPEEPEDVRNVPDAVPKHEPKSRYGNMKSYEVFGKTYYTKDSSQGYVAHGHASWYGTKFHGERTSSGETYDMYEMTAAHKSLPLPTYARVTNTKNGKSVIVKINDRGPFVGDRIIDLSYAAAARIGILQQGVAHVKVEAIDPHQFQKSTPAPIPTIMAAEQKQTQDTKEFYLQLAAFGERIYADDMVEELETLIQQPIAVNQNGKDPYYRVQVGPFKDENSAKAFQKELASLIPQKPMLIAK